ncbi:MAG: hypothetical protein KKB20_17870 [Proteobacteria bacterium]|nr:hypothetical protein [Pseudomonadota bacterium]
MSKKQLIAVLMLSPLYFTLTLRERLIMLDEMLDVCLPLRPGSGVCAFPAEIGSGTA